MEVTRGSIVTIAARGAYTSKPRPALVVQSDLFNSTHSSVTVCPITSDCVDAPLFRITLAPGQRTGLSAVSQVMVDKIVSIPRESVGTTVGRCTREEVETVCEAVRLWLAL